MGCSEGTPPPALNYLPQRDWGGGESLPPSVCPLMTSPSSNPKVTQMALVELNGSQNKPPNHESRKGAGREGELIGIGRGQEKDYDQNV